MVETVPNCRFCGSKTLAKAGIHYAGGRKQRWLCKSCGRVFIAPLPQKLDLKRLARALRKRGVRRAALFGSYARGEAQPGSDVDLLLEFSKPVGLLRLVQIRRELSEMLGVKVDLGTKLDPFTREDIKEDMRVILK
jgi:predicted nucleotidyltransferase